MPELSERLRRLRERALGWRDSQRAYVGRRLYHALQGLIAQDPALPWAERRAGMLAHIIAHMEPLIHEDELIVGYNYYGSGEYSTNEVALARLPGADLTRLEAYLSQGELSREQIDFILETAPRLGPYLAQTAYVAAAPAGVEAARQDGVLESYGTSENHTVIGFARVLQCGFAGLKDEIAARLSELDWRDPANLQPRLQLESAARVADAACTLGLRYAEAAREQLAACGDDGSAPGPRADLVAIIETTGQVPAYPARTFREAIQSLWFAHICSTWEDGINANSLGRLDQILYPYYAADLAAGRLTDTEAFELLACLWLKLYRDYDVQQVTLSGVDAEGHDATNDLTYLMLDVTEALDFVRCLGVRIHRESPEPLLRRCLELVRLGKGIPFFFNDDTLVPALVAAGISLQDARDYANIGCVETTIPGKANPHAVSNRINLLKCLELALNDGTSLTTGVQLGPHTGPVAGMRSLEDVIRAYELQVEHFTTLACLESCRRELISAQTLPMPFKSLLTEGCLESGRDFNAGGARYNFHESQAMGIPNVAESLAALDELVFRRGRYTLSDVVGQMAANFPDETMRLTLLRRAPKYGNDVPAVDNFAVRVLNHFCDVVAHQRGVWGQGFFAQPFTYLWHIEMGEKTAATPDGRRRGEIMAYSVSPMQGRDASGLTAVLNSLARLPHHRAPGSTSAIIEIDPPLFTPEALPLMVAFLRTAIANGVGQLQFNVVSAETLRRAQLEPEKYGNLAVRVSGYSQRFCLLDRQLQDHIIARTKHSRG